MTKQEACDIFGGTQAALARVLEMTRGGISQWPDDLTEAQADRVIGAAVRLGLPIPAQFIARSGSVHQAASGGRHRQMQG